MDSTLSFPKQKLARGQKNTKWGKECLDAAETASHLTTSGVRSSYRNKKINYDLANDKLNFSDFEKLVSPYGIENINFPAKLQNYPIALPKIDLLVGEEYKRRFDYVIRLVNPEAISEKNKTLMQDVLANIQDMIKSQDLSEEEANRKLRELQNMAMYSFQDIKERDANRLLNFYEKEQDFKFKFNKGFYDALLAGEELYCVDVIVGEPILRKVDPLEITALRAGNSPYLEDAELIIEDSYYPVGKVIDNYWDVLKQEDIKKLEAKNLSAGIGKGRPGSIDIGKKEPMVLMGGTFTEETDKGGGYINIDDEDGPFFGPSFDFDGNVRVMRAVWKSFRKIGILKFYDQETGEPEKKFVDEYYKPNKAEGETVEWKWISEWWEGTKIGFGDEAIYIKIQPRPLQLRKYSTGNLSVCRSGYVGTYYNINSSKSLSLMDRMKPFQYLYNALTYRLELAFAKSYGKIMRLPLHEKPDHLSDEQYLSYILGTNIMPYNAFQEGKRGAATGKLAGNMQQSNQTIDMEQGQYIAQHLETLRWLKEEVGEISGVSRQRQSQISSQEAVGNVQRSIIQSSHITEKWFSIHENTKKRVLQTFLETAQFCLRNNNERKQFVTDDMQTVMMDIHPEVSYEEMGIFISSEDTDTQLRDDLKQLLQQQAQNDRFRLSTFISLYRTDSVQDLTRKLEGIEAAQDEAQERARKEELQAKAEAEEKNLRLKERELEIKDKEREDKREIATEDNMTNVKVAEIRSFALQQDQDKNRDGVPDQLQTEQLKLERELKHRELSIKEKEVNAKIREAKNKPKPKS